MIQQQLKRKIYLEVELTTNVNVGQTSRSLEIGVQDMIIALMNTVKDQEEDVDGSVTIRSDIWTDPL